METRNVLTTQQAAVLLELSTTSVQKMVSNGELDAWITPGGHRRIFRSSVEQLRNSRNNGLAGITGRLPLRILLVEDDPTQIAFFKMLIERVGHSVQLTIIDRLSQALDHIRALRPNLLVIDLPSEHGEFLSLFSAMASDAELKGLDVIVLTEQSSDPSPVIPPVSFPVVRCQKPLNAERLCGYMDALTSKLLARAALADQINGLSA